MKDPVPRRTSRIEVRCHGRKESPCEGYVTQ